MTDYLTPKSSRGFLAGVLPAGSADKMPLNFIRANDKEQPHEPCLHL